VEATETKDNEKHFGQFFKPDDLHIKTADLFNKRINGAIRQTLAELSIDKVDEKVITTCLIAALATTFQGFKEPIRALLVAKKYLDEIPKETYEKQGVACTSGNFQYFRKH